MERRDFLKYLATTCAFACCACGQIEPAIEENENEEEIYRKKYKISHFGFSICYYCNLNCAYCNHFSPISPKEVMSFEAYKKDIKKLHKITKGEVGEIALVGGEPLLHKDIEKFMEVTDKYFPDTYKKLTTNGILLSQMSDSFFKTCAKTNFRIHCTLYPSKGCPTKEDLSILSKEKKVIIRASQVKNMSFKKTNFNKIPQKGSENNDKKCIMNVKCAQIDNGKIYPCCVMSNIRFFNKYFKDYAIEPDKNDYLELDKISTVEEILNYFKQHKEFCKYCNYGKETQPWRLSKHELSEWYEVKS